jgi:hypothetical protein
VWIEDKGVYLGNLDLLQYVSNPKVSQRAETIRIKLKCGLIGR